MTTATTSATISNASTATMNTWIEEVCNAIFTTCGCTQTSDTGQLWSPNTATGTLPGSANASAGYVIGKFNDTLQTSYPVFFRLDFGTGAAVADPAMWITVGTGSNGSGTINGTVMTKVACFAAAAWPISTSTNYSSYYCYNSTYGTLFVGMKYASFNASVPGGPGMGFYLFRGSSSTGGEADDAINLLSSSNSATGVSAYNSSSGFMQCLSYAKSTVYPTTSTGYAPYWFTPPLFGYGGAIAGDSPTIWPCYYMNPAPCISNVLGLVDNGDVNVGTTFTATVIGSTSATYLNTGALTISYSIGASGGGPASDMTVTLTGLIGSSTTQTNTYGIAVLWQ